jgi:sugar phosphate isomerase/epimerase
MRLAQLPGDVHLTYCTNIHAGETWDEIRASVEAHVPAIKRRVSPEAPMGLGLRLSAIAAEALGESTALDEFARFLADHDLYVFTINAFPYGPFHGRRVKENVYQPDWLSADRLAFTDRVAGILAALLPPGMVGSMSTVPGTFKPIGKQPGAVQAIAENLARHVVTLVDIARHTGRELVLALEPEPCCLIETVEETVEFFRDHLHAESCAAFVARQAGIDMEEARAALRRHLGICYDVCHGAIEFEEPAAAFATLRRAGIRIAKVQLSSALRVTELQDSTAASLIPFDDGVYLHQVVQRRNGALTRYVDLAPALAALRAGEAGGEWRIHCHVPIFLEAAGQFRSTQPTLAAALDCARAGFVAPHLEVETYTWDVLPPELRAGSRADVIARELEWVLGKLH